MSPGPVLEGEAAGARLAKAAEIGMGAIAEK